MSLRKGHLWGGLRSYYTRHAVVHAATFASPPLKMTEVVVGDNGVHGQAKARCMGGALKNTHPQAAVLV